MPRIPRAASGHHSGGGAGDREQQDERDAGRAAVCGVTGRERGADWMNQSVGGRGRPTRILSTVELSDVKRLGDRECDQREPAPADEQEDPDGRERQRPAEAAAERVEDERNVREQRRSDVLHRLRPAPVDLERRHRHDHRHQRDDAEQRDPDPERAGGRNRKRSGMPMQGLTDRYRQPARRRAIPGADSRASPTSQLESLWILSSSIASAIGAFMFRLLWSEQLGRAHLLFIVACLGSSRVESRVGRL